jgi:hypothetical protein
MQPVLDGLLDLSDNWLFIAVLSPLHANDPG